MKNHQPNNLNKTTDMISTLIHEYLYKKEYNKTLDSFQERTWRKNKNRKILFSNI